VQVPSLPTVKSGTAYTGPKLCIACPPNTIQASSVENSWASTTSPVTFVLATV